MQHLLNYRWFYTHAMRLDQARAAIPFHRINVSEVCFGRCSAASGCSPEPEEGNGPSKFPTVALEGEIEGQARIGCSL